MVFSAEVKVEAIDTCFWDTSLKKGQKMQCCVPRFALRDLLPAASILEIASIGNKFGIIPS